MNYIGPETWMCENDDNGEPPELNVFDRECVCGHLESEHRVGKTADFGGYCCAYIGTGGAGFRTWCQCPGFHAYEGER